MEKSQEFKRRFELAARTAKWAVTMTKVRIRRATKDKPFPHWHLLDFCGPYGGEARGVVDMIAVRKDHRKPQAGTKRGDALQIILIQVKGGSAAKPTKDDGERLRVVARHHGNCPILYAAWKKGKEARFFSLRSKAAVGEVDWTPETNLSAIFC